MQRRGSDVADPGLGWNTVVGVEAIMNPSGACTYKRDVAHPCKRQHGPHQGYLENYLRYLTRPPKGPDGGPSHYLVAPDVILDLERFLAALWQDHWCFLIFANPDPIHSASLDLDAVGQLFMRQVETDVKGRIDWIGAPHFDTSPKLHLHFAWRGRLLDGSPLWLKRSYISHGLRYRLQQLEEWEERRRWCS
jgi:hypothetical protein